MAPCAPNLAAKLVDPIAGQLNEQTALVLTRPILAQDDFAPATVDLADCPVAVGFMPFLLETQFVDVKPYGAMNIGYEEHGPRVPVMSDSLANG
jgi:hypothetical protein